MLQNLELSFGRIGLKLQSAKEMDKTMEISWPIFEVILSTCMFEVWCQKSIESSIQVSNILPTAIESMSSKLTESAINTSQLTLQASNTPVLVQDNLNQNMLMLGSAMENIVKQRETLLLQTGSNFNIKK